MLPTRAAVSGALLLVALPLLAAPTVAPVAAPAAADPQRAEFREAWAAVADGHSGATDSAALRKYPLYPYLQAARLRRALSRVREPQRDPATEGAVRGFLEKHRTEPVARELTRDWLQLLGRRGDWATFREDAPSPLTDVALRCHEASARIAADDLDGLREVLLDLWLSATSVPNACDAPLQWLDTRERLSDEDVQRRARFAADNGLSLPATLAHLAPEQRAPFVFRARLLDDPEAGIRKVLAGENLAARAGLPPPPAEAVDDALLLAFERLAVRDSKRSAPLFGKLAARESFSDEERDVLRRLHALGLAYDHRPEAVDEFEEVPEKALDARAHEWRVRAALYHGRWKLASQWLDAMPEPQRDEPRWMYWRARALELRRDTDEARQLYAAVAKEREYYAFLAAERLGQLPDLRPVAVADDPATTALLSVQPAMVRARELFFCELPELAVHEWRHALRDLPPAAKPQAAKLVHSWGWYEPAILLLSELQMWDDLWLRFPLPYAEAVEKAAKDTGLPADWIWSVMRTESLYNPRAVSGADAIGLLQMLPRTARQVAAQSRLPKPSRSDLFMPEVNIALGARYLAELQERFGGRFILTLAAYNAGPHRVPDWKPRHDVPADIWIENIPYTETRGYVQRALSTLVMISWRRTGEPAALAPLLPVITVAGDDGPP